MVTLPHRRKAFRGGAFGNRPPTETGLKLFFDASQESFASDALVASPTDWSGNGFSPTQTTDANKPTFKTDIQNGRAVFRLDGTNDQWIFGSGAYGILNGASGSSLYAVASTQTVAAGTRSLFYAFSATSGAIRTVIRANTTAGRFSISARANDADATTALNTNTALTTNRFYAFGAVADFPNGDYFVTLDGVEDASNLSVPVSAAYSNTNSFGMGLGSSPVNNQYWFGDIACVLVYAVPHDLTQRAAVNAWLKGRWGIP